MLAGLTLNPLGLPTEGAGAQGFVNQLGQNLTAGAARALIDTAINGGSLQDGLEAALKSAFLDTIAAQGANAIGDLKVNGTLDAFTHKVAHAIAGCAVGTARSGDAGGCAAGAIGAAVGELAAEGYGRREDTVQFAAMIGSLAVAVSGGDATQIAQGGQAAANAAANNYLSHDENEERKQARKNCYDNGDAAACDRLTALNNLDAQRDQRVIELANNCKDDCVQVAQFVNDELTALGCTGPYVCDDETLERAWRVASEKAQGLLSDTTLEEMLFLGYGLARGSIQIASGRTAEGGSRLVVTDALGLARDNVSTGSAIVDVRKFSDYIFKPMADHGKDAVFKSLGYTSDDSVYLSELWRKQAIEKYAKKEFKLGRRDQYGQRIDIEIVLPGKGAAAGEVSYLRSGWMIQADGSLKLNTPFSGFVK